MNRRCHRLVVDRRRGMRVPAAEHVRAVGRAGGGGTPAPGGGAAALLAAALALGGAAPATAQIQRAPVVRASQLPAPVHALPQPYGSTSGRSDRTFVASPAQAGGVRWSVDGTRATLDQGTHDRVILNWDSFDIAAGHAVHFKQNPDPTRYVSALNRIWSEDPTRILGALSADREVILVNANGVYFGRGAVVDTGRFVASSLAIADQVFERGLRNVRDGSPVFTTPEVQGPALARWLDSAVGVESGARLRSAAGGDVLLVAPRVLNEGRIETPRGQTVLAAGGTVYLMSSSDPAQRGLIVAVAPLRAADGSIDRSLGVVENRADGQPVGPAADPTRAQPDAAAALEREVNEIHAESGTINLVGLAVRQNGRLRATTAVKGANGTILLQGQESVQTLLPNDSNGIANRGLAVEPGAAVTVGARLGEVSLGSDSRTEVQPSADDGATQLDAEVFNRSRIRVEGRTIELRSGASVHAPSGRIELLAAADAGVAPALNSGASTPTAGDGSRIRIEPGVAISAAGLREVPIDGSRNQGSLRLFRIELADAPVQRDGPLYRAEVQFDLRNSAAIGVADVGGAAATVRRNARERSAVGGSVRIETEGALEVADGARIDISGGSLRYGEARIATSVLTRGARGVTIDRADPGLRYDGLAPAQEQQVPAYDEGRDGGQLSVVAREGRFAGQLDAHVLAGPSQREGRGRAAPAAASFGRQDGLLYDLPRIGLGLRAGDGFELALPMLQASGLGRLALRAGEVVQTGGEGLALGAGGVLDIGAATGIALAGAWQAPGGSIRLRTNGTDPARGDIRLADGGELDTAGRWVNDGSGRAAGAAVQSDGGSIELSAARSVLLGSGTRLDVSAGAWRNAAGRVTTGKAGSLTLAAGNRAGATLELGGTLTGLDFGAGGRLTLAVPGLDITDAPAAGFALAPSFFSTGGFGTIGVSSLGGVVLTSGTRLAPTLDNWVLAADHALAPSGYLRDGAARAERLDEALADRKPVNLSFTATRAPNAGEPGASVVVERGAQIVLEEAGRLELVAARDVVIGASGRADGGPTRIEARGGEVVLRTTGKRGAGSTDNQGEDPVGFVPEQAIWIGSNASIDVSGAADGPAAASGQRVPGATGRQVLGGGRIGIEAARGYVVAEAGSRLALDGIVAPLVLPGTTAPVSVARSAGALAIATPEGFSLGGEVSAQPPRDGAGRPLADGGRLTLDLGRGGVSRLTLGRPYPAATLARRIEVADAPAEGPAPRYGDDLTVALPNGRGKLAPRLLEAAGMDALTLRAGDEIAFGGAVRIEQGLSIEIDAPAIRAAAGTEVMLAAPRVALGSLFTDRNGDAPAADSAAEPAAAAAPGAGEPRLMVRAATIDLAGTFGLKGFGRTLLDAGADAAGQIRLAGLGATAPAGRLAFAGTLDLVAPQIFATTLSRFELLGLEAWRGQPVSTRLTVAAPAGGTPAPPLSAFGELRLSASDIVQAGVLWQPFGTIALAARDTLTLAAGSLSSVSGEGVVLPLGTTNNLSSWTVPGVAGELGAPPTAKRVTLDARVLVTDPASRLSAAGGGDVQASEFFPGVGGSRDYFDTPGLYAVLPDYRAGFAPRTTQPADAAAAATGQQIEITMPGSGLAPGRYTLLPPRYALLADSLPGGAFLVSRTAEGGATPLASALARDDGSTVVTGYLTQTGSRETGLPGQRFVVEPAATFRARSEVRTSLMSEFFDTRAERRGELPGAVPRDGGSVTVRVTEPGGRLFAPTIDLGAPGTARAGALDVVAPRLALVREPAGVAADELGVSAAVVENAAAASVLLGALRGPTAGGTTPLDTSLTLALRVASGPQPLRAQELVLAARERLAFDDDSTLVAAGGGGLGPRTLQASGDGALAALSSHDGLALARSAAPLLGGTLAGGERVRLQAPSVQLDATDSVQLAADSELVAGRLALGGQRITIGDTGDATGATPLAGPLLDAALGAGAIELRSYSSIDFAGRQDFARRGADGTATRVIDSLVLDAPALRGMSAAGSGEAPVLDIAAREVTLRNSAGTGGAGAGGSGGLRIEALPGGTAGGGLTLGPGTMALGFDSAVLHSRGDIVLAGNGGLRAQDALTLAAARVTAQTAAEHVLAAGGRLDIAAGESGRTSGERVGQGARLTLDAVTIEQAGRIELPGGSIIVQASGTAADRAAIRFAPGSLTSAAGFALQAQPDWTVHGDAGRIEARAAQGRIEIDGRLDVSASGAGSAGTLVLAAAGAGGRVAFGPGAELAGQRGSAAADRGGTLQLDLHQQDPGADGRSTLARTAALAGAGGFDREFQLRLRQGGLLVDGGLKAARIGLAADTGGIEIGAVNLDTDAAAGGLLEIAARDDLQLREGAVLSARSSRSGANGGDVLLASAEGRLRLDAGARVLAGGDDAADGRIVLRAPRGSGGAAAAVNIDPFDSTRLLAGELSLEAVRSYRTVTVAGVTRDITAIAAGNSALAGSGSNRTGTLGQASLRADNANFIGAAGDVLGALGVGAAERERVHLRAGVEVQASGNLTVSGDWNLAFDRAGGEAGLLTLRAAGNLTFNGSLSDGFAAVQATAALNDNARSWSYRLVAGADLGAADPLTTRPLAEAGSGDLTIGAGRLVRTGAGSIELAAGRDIVFGGSGTNVPGAAYVAGRRAADAGAVLDALFAAQTDKPQITEQGGRLELAARRDIVAPRLGQTVNNWLWRSGAVDPGDATRYADFSHLAWWPQWQRFQQHAASFGGGNVHVDAGRNITNLALAVPSTGWADAPERALAQLVVRNGGDLDVRAGGSITDGMYLLGRGEGRMQAGAAVTSSREGSVQSIAFGLMDGHWQVAAARGLRVGTVFNPTGTGAPTTDGRSLLSGYFGTYGAATGVSGFSGSSLSGDVVLSGAGGVANAYRLVQADALFQAMPANLSLLALGGSVATRSNLSAALAPSAGGRLEVFASGDINLGSGSTLALVDAVDGVLPSFRDPFLPSFGTPSALLENLTGVTQVVGVGGLADRQAHGALRADDREPVRIAAGGSITAGERGALNLSKPALVSAGLDITGLALLGQHHRADDLTRVSAGRNVLYSDVGGLTLAGPGRLEVQAGRQIDLGASAGVLSIGNASNPTLPPQGASIRLAAGLAGTPDLANLEAAYLSDSSGSGAAARRAALVDFVNAALGGSALGYDEALERFRAFEPAQQERWVRRLQAEQFAQRYLVGPVQDRPALEADLASRFERYRIALIEAGRAALASGGTLVLPGNEVLAGARLAAYVAELDGLRLAAIDVSGALQQRAQALAGHAANWRLDVAAALGSTPQALEALRAGDPAHPLVQRYDAELVRTSGPLFERARNRVLAAELASAGSAAADFGVRTLPVRLALYDQGFLAAEAAGVGNFESSPWWDGVAPALRFTGTLNMTQSSVITRRGGDIELLNPGGPINVGLKDSADGRRSGASGVIALGGGSVFGFARGDFQVNNQRVFVVGDGNMTLWSSRGDIDSGRGQNTAVGAPPLEARRTADGVVFEVPPTTTGSGLGILPDAAGRSSGSIGLYPAYGEILALDAFIRAPVVRLGSTIRGADNIQAPAVGGSAVAVSAPALATPSAPAPATAPAGADGATRGTTQESRQRSGLLTVELLGLGSEAPCGEEDERAGRCKRAP
jgi:filamentous hemagglutinin family protein